MPLHKIPNIILPRRIENSTRPFVNSSAKLEHEIAPLTRQQFAGLECRRLIASVQTASHSSRARFSRNKKSKERREKENAREPNKKGKIGERKRYLHDVQKMCRKFLLGRLSGVSIFFVVRLFRVSIGTISFKRGQSVVRSFVRSSASSSPRASLKSPAPRKVF